MQSRSDGWKDKAAPSGHHHFDITVDSVDQGVRTALAELISGLDACDLAPEETGTVQLVVAEILNNIIEHAFTPDAPFEPIRINAALRRDGLHLAIRDQGRPMPDGKLPIAALPSIDVDFTDLPEGGFGWFLIHELARDVAYNRVAEENLLSLRIAVGAKALN